MTTTEPGRAERAVDEGEGADSPYTHTKAHFGIEPGEEWPEDVPHDQDDTWWRYQDDAKGARRAEMRIAACWTVTLLAGLALAVTYCLGAQSQAIGIELALGFLALGAGMVLWARDLLPGHEVTASRGHHDRSSDDARLSVVESLERAVGPVARRPFLFKMLGGVATVFGICAAFPIASLGSRPHTTLYRTGWKAGDRLVTENGRPLRPGDLEPGGILTVFPESQVDDLTAPDAAQSATLLINVGDANKFEVQKKRVGWNIGPVVAFSKICTHAACPVGLYNQESHQLVCPCHQSTFDVLQDCKPVFGPAPRSLPQLPLAVNADGYLIAQSDYHEAVGPGFWNRG
jgi:ubiquinol-cytochrome c reductase iron-sulfur subunit